MKFIREWDSYGSQWVVLPTFAIDFEDFAISFHWLKFEFGFEW